MYSIINSHPYNYVIATDFLGNYCKNFSQNNMKLRLNKGKYLAEKPYYFPTPEFPNIFHLFFVFFSQLFFSSSIFIFSYHIHLFCNISHICLFTLFFVNKVKYNTTSFMTLIFTLFSKKLSAIIFTLGACKIRVTTCFDTLIL